MPVQLDAHKVPYVDYGRSRLQLQHDEFTEALYKDTALKELRETPENVEKGLRELRELLKANTELVVPDDDDAFLTKFLRMSKHYPQGAYERICKYYKFKVEFPTEGKYIVPEKVRAVFERGVINVQGPRDQFGRRIVMFNTGGNWDTNAVPLLEFFRGMQMAMEAASQEPRSQVAGAIIIMDLQGFGLAQAKTFTPHLVRNMAEWMQDMIPVRLKAVHFMNQPYLFNMVFALFKPFLRAKLSSRIHFHGTGRDRLRSMVTPVALLPRFGGQMAEEDLPGEDLWELFRFYEDKFRYTDSYGYEKKPKK